jgi:hypothetical protein
MKSLSLLGRLALVLHFGACVTSSDISGEGLNAPTDTAAAGGSVADTAAGIAKDAAMNTAKGAAINAVTNKIGGGAASAVNTGHGAVNTANALR